MKSNMKKGYRGLSQEFVEALMKKQVKLHVAIDTGVRWVKLDRDSMTQSWTRASWLWLWRLLNTCTFKQ